MSEWMWKPSDEAVAASQLTGFARLFGAQLGRDLSRWNDLHRASVTEFRAFWRLFLDWAGVIHEGDPSTVCAGDDVETARFFPDLRLSYAENLLRPGDDDDEHLAIVACDEQGVSVRLTRGELRARVIRLARGLAELGVGQGTRVAAIVRDDAETMIACLAATALGAAWSSVAMDLAPELVLARLAQLEPALLFAHGRDWYQGVERDAAPSLAKVVAGLPTVKTVIMLDETRPSLARDTRAAAEVGIDSDAPWSWPRFPFDQPLFVLFSSGTTGVPKCIVHGTGGSLLEHLKEHRLHGDLRRDDRLYVHTTPGWMMWNWQLTALGAGATLVLYDGSVTHPELDALWALIARERVTVFSTSAAYLQLCRDGGVEPRQHDLSALRTICSTGSILYEVQYDWTFENVKPLPLQSISGGTDMLGCFVLGNPNLPLYRGESQCLGLALDVREWHAEGAPDNDIGELVCGTPFPSRPTMFFADPDRTRYHNAYFAQRPGLWTHGDFIAIHPERGTARILGRSDGVLNVRGLRIGPAEITRIANEAPEIAESMAIEQRAPDEPGGSRIVLLVVMKPGATLDRPLTFRIKKELKARASASHVPAVIADVPALPLTFNNKRSERAATDAANGKPISNLVGLKNPECLDAIRNHPLLQVSS